MPEFFLPNLSDKGKPDVSWIDVLSKRPAGEARPHRVRKSWGWEDIYYNQSYCMKVLHFDSRAEQDATSMHFHLHKHETLLVVAGVLELTYVRSDKYRHTVALTPGKSWVVPPGHLHSLKRANKNDLIVVEASTYDDPEDSIQVE